MNIAGLDEWYQWLNGNGQRCVYHRSLNGSSPNHEQKQIVGAAWKAASRRQVYLLQKRIKGGIEYLAFKPRAGAMVPEALTAALTAVEIIRGCREK
jgi:hypothetical protein